MIGPPNAAESALQDLQAAVRAHRDQKGDDRCWEDDVKLYKALPEGYEAPESDTCVELENCKRYIACRHNPNTIYVSPQRRIEELEAKMTELASLLKQFNNCGISPDGFVEGVRKLLRKPNE